MSWIVQSIYCFTPVRASHCVHGAACQHRLLQDVSAIRSTCAALSHPHQQFLVANGTGVMQGGSSVDHLESPTQATWDCLVATCVSHMRVFCFLPADDAAEVPAGRPPKLAKKLKTADVGAAAATAAAAAAAKAQQAPAQQPVNPSKTRSKQATAASAAASAGAESVASPANKRRKLGAAAAPASGPSSAKALAQGAGVDGVSKPAKAKDKPAAVSAAAAADAGKGSKAKPNAAAAAAGAAAASKPKPAKASKAASQPEQKAGSKSAQAAAGGSKQQQQQPPAGASGAGTSTAADQGPKQKKPRVPQPREIPALPVYHPAKVCEEEWRAQQDAYIADMAAIRRQALGARPPVLFKKVTKKGKGKNVEEWVPVFEATSEDLPVRVSN